MKLRKLADQTGWTIADIMHDLMEEYVARHKAEGNEKRKLFDSRNAKSARNRRFKFQKRTQLCKEAMEGCPVEAIGNDGAIILAPVRA